MFRKGKPGFSPQFCWYISPRTHPSLSPKDELSLSERHPFQINEALTKVAIHQWMVRAKWDQTEGKSISAGHFLFKTSIQHRELHCQVTYVTLGGYVSTFIPHNWAEIQALCTLQAFRSYIFLRINTKAASAFTVAAIHKHLPPEKKIRKISPHSSRASPSFQVLTPKPSV